MKKQLLLLLMILLPMVASADVVEIDGIYYNLIAKGNGAEVTRIPNAQYSGNIVIPEKITYEGADFSVKSIGDAAFYGCSSLTSVTIPNSVTYIGERAFRGCSGLTFVTIPNSVTSIGESAFMVCTGLTSVTIPNSVTSINGGAFQGCSGLTSVTIPNSVTSIGDAAFWGCSSLTSVTIPNSVKTIDVSAFYGCSGLTSVTIPNSVKSIGGYAFCDCSGLTSVTIPNSVTSIGDAAFMGCSGLTSVTIPNSVTSIGNYTFENCSGLISVTIPNSVTSIDEWAFKGCPELTDVYCLAEKVPNTDSDAFKDSYIEYATLHVPAASIGLYQTAEPWKNFKAIVTVEGGDIPKCATPTISYKDGKLTFECATEGVEFISEITDTDIKKHYDAVINLTATYNISVYATKTGYNNSETATATLCWIDAEPKTEGITNGVAQVRALPVMIQAEDGLITVQGADDGTQVAVYTLNGVQAGSAISKNGQATIHTALAAGTASVVKIGSKAVKVMMR